jgi:UDP-3-O-[3-hydroxymyristoyl] N-acetylglucosamine deacetylase
MKRSMRQTLRTPVRAEGAALHSGGLTRIAVLPAPAGSGVVFRRVDRDGPPAAREIPALAANVKDARLGVRIANDAGAAAMTIEHLMAAFALAEIDDAIVEIDREELPIFDGSVGAFLELIERAGQAPLAAPRRCLKVAAPIRVESGDRWVEISPDAGRRFRVEIDFSDRAIGKRAIAFDLGDGGFRRRIAAARTFCSLADVEAMQRAGFARGGSLDNAIVVDGERILNPEGLRDPDEFALHKAGDLIGDLSLVGAPVLGFVKASKPGHDINTKLAARICAQAAWAESPAG